MFAVALVLVLQSAVATQTIDRLVAVVGNDPIFLSDVRDAMRLRLLDPAGPLAPMSDLPGATDEEKALERLIIRRLVLAEVARYSQAPPPAADVEAALKDRADRDPALVAFVSDTLRINRYIEQRFTAAAQPTREEARAAYKGTAPFETVEEQARRQLAEQRRLAMVRDWIRGLRDRAQVRVIR